MKLAKARTMWTLALIAVLATSCSSVVSAQHQVNLEAGAEVEAKADIQEQKRSASNMMRASRQAKSVKAKSVKAPKSHKSPKATEVPVAEPDPEPEPEPEPEPDLEPELPKVPNPKTGSAVPEMKYHHTVEITTDPFIQIAEGPTGTRWIIPATSEGTARGPNFNADVSGPGGDWVTRRNDGSISLNFKFMLTTDDGVNILWQGTGASRLDPIDWTKSYFRVQGTYEAPAGTDYSYLNYLIFYGRGLKIGNTMYIDMFDMPDEGWYNPAGCDECGM